jgi:H+-transporting ATPase
MSDVALSTGLTSAEAHRRLEASGPNVVPENAPPAWRLYLGKFWAPIPWLLEAAVAAEVTIGRPVEAAVVGALLLFNATLGFVQEGRANKALAALKQRLAPTAVALRDGTWTRIAAAEVVVGDTVNLPLGARVPADARIVSGAALIDQSQLTGESIPAEAEVGATVYAGSLVRRGQAVAQVTATGGATYFGRTARLVQSAHAAGTEQKAIFGVTRGLAAVNGVVTAVLVVAAWAIALPPGQLFDLALTALLATIPVALPATFTLSAAFAAQALARRKVLLTRLSAVHDAAAMDVLCADKTGTLTRNALQVDTVVPLAGFDRDAVLAAAAAASSEADPDPIDTAVCAAASGLPSAGRRLHFEPFDPSTRMARADVIASDGSPRQAVKGAIEAIAAVAGVPEAARRAADALAANGDRVLTVATGSPGALQLTGLIAINDPPREDSAALVTALRDLGVRTVMVSGDSAATAAAIARRVGIVGKVQTGADPTARGGADDVGVFARVLPEAKFGLVRSLQGAGHVVGMCGDGTNDAPALRQAQIGVAVSTATDVAKAAAGMVLTEPGLGGIVLAVREGRIAFERLLAFTFNMVAKKIEIVLFLALGLGLTGGVVLTPTLMVVMLMTNDFLAMSLTTDRATPAPLPSAWRMRRITPAAAALGASKLGFSLAVLAWGRLVLGLGQRPLQTLAFVTLVAGSQALLLVARERRVLWSSRPSRWVVASIAANLAIVVAAGLGGALTPALPWPIVATIFAATAAFALVLDRIKLAVRAAFAL